MPEDGEVFGAVFLAVTGLILVHDDVEAPMQAVLHAPMGAVRAG